MKEFACILGIVLLTPLGWVGLLIFSFAVRNALGY